jgi:uncharacterized protein (TIGR02271 family)
MDNTVPADRVELHTGMEVVSSDGDKLGKVVQLDASRLTVEKGFFFPHDYVIPMSAVDSADDAIYLNLSKDDALNQRWSDVAAIDPGAMSTAASVTEPATTTTGVSATNVSDETLRVPVYEEELTATTRPVEAGNIQINKEVVTEDRMLEVPITEERVRVTRRAVDRDATGATRADAFTEDTIDVPVQTEAVDVQKRLRAAEEVDITKEPVQKTETVTGTVRREVVDVQDNTDVNVTDGTSGATAGSGY